MGDILVDDLSIKAYSLLQEVCINGLKHKGVYQLLQIQIYVSVLQIGWVTLGSFHVLLLYKMDG